jgi:hypothetical protein
MITPETIHSRSDELRLWLIVNGMLDVCFFLVLVGTDRPLPIVGIMLVIHLIVALPVLYAFHKTSVVEAVMQHSASGGDVSSGIVPPCDGACGTGGTAPAFVCYMLFFALHTYRLAIVYTTCAFNTYKLKLDSVSYIQLSAALVFLMASIFFVELGRRANARVDLYI